MQEVVESVAEKELEDLLKKCRRVFRVTDEALITKAFWRSFQAHKNQKRASGNPYYTHPLQVAHILLDEIPLDSISVASSLLHDVVEDSDYSQIDIRKEFGEEVALIVDGLTKISDMFANREITEAENFRKMLLTMVTDIRTILIKFCDRLHNMRTLEWLPSHRQVKIATQSRDIYALLAHRFGLFKVKTELEDLAFKWLNAEDYQLLSKKLENLHLQIERIEHEIKPIRKILTERGLNFEISARQKNIYSIYKKIIRKNKPLKEIYDIYGVRITLDHADPSLCYSVYGDITYKLFSPITERFKDYITRPKKNGYQSLHATLLARSGQIFEIQIRTKAMHEVAENGIAAHWKYKQFNNKKGAANDQDPLKDNKSIEKMIRWAKELLETDYSSEGFLEAFRMNLDHDDVYVFTPKGDVRALPKGATVLDFAFDIHTQIGMKCIGAKINGRTVAIRQRLNSGDQVEIITSKNQKPSSNWEKFVVTGKARTNIRQFLNQDTRKSIEQGKEIWEKTCQKNEIKKLKEEHSVSISPEKVALFCGKRNTSEFFSALADNSLNAVKIIRDFFEKTSVTPRANDPISYSHHNRATKNAINDSSNSPVVIDDIKGSIAFDYAGCCNPIPGDPIIGMVSKAGIVKIHRRACQNINNTNVLKSNKLLSSHWNTESISDQSRFLSTMKISGFDRMGITNELTSIILKSGIDIKNISLNSSTEGEIKGSIMLYVENLSKLNKLIDSLKSVQGIFGVDRDNLTYR